MSNVLNAHAIREHGVDPALEVIAVGHHEELTFYNPSPEPDSIFELLPTVVRPGDNTRKFGGLLVQAHKLNGQQGSLARGLVGYLDSVAVDLSRKPSGSQSLAKALRPHLRTLAETEGISAGVLAAAVREVDRITVGLSDQQLSSPALAHQLGRKRFAVLSDLRANREAS